MTTPVAAAPAPPALAPAAPGWLRNRSFDPLFIGGVAALALLSCSIVLWRPALFPLVIVADLWLLGFHHVISTFTRIAFDQDSFRAHRFLVLGLPPLILVAVVVTVKWVGLWVVPTLYLYWQWFHYTRQSWGIAQIYRRKAGALGAEPPLLTKATIYLLPLWGILYRSWLAPAEFLSMEIRTPPVPLLLVQAVAALAIVAVGWWVVRQVVAWTQGRLPVAYTLYMLSHLGIFAAGYLLVDNLDYGWLTINVWHNAQYILLVWMYNNNRFKGGIDPRHRFLSSISQPGRGALYFLACLCISTLVYAGLSKVVLLFGMSVMTVSVIVYQTINFHHYIVDSIIWKVRKPPLRANLGLAS
jgi:hypothetical protein